MTARPGQGGRAGAHGSPPIGARQSGSASRPALSSGRPAGPGLRSGDAAIFKDRKGRNLRKFA